LENYQTIELLWLTQQKNTLNLKLIGGAIAGPHSLAAGIVTSAGDIFDPTKQVRLL
jgi:hypothetical protein